MPRRCLQITEAKIIVENISYAQVAIAAVKSVAFDKLPGIPCNFPVNFVYGGLQSHSADAGRAEKIY